MLRGPSASPLRSVFSAASIAGDSPLRSVFDERFFDKDLFDRRQCAGVRRLPALHATHVLRWCAPATRARPPGALEERCNEHRRIEPTGGQWWEHHQKRDRPVVDGVGVRRDPVAALVQVHVVASVAERPPDPVKDVVDVHPLLTPVALAHVIRAEGSHGARETIATDDRRLPQGTWADERFAFTNNL